MRRLGFVCLLTWIALAMPVQAQGEKQITLRFDGPEFFCHILFSKSLTPIVDFDEAASQPKESMIVVFGSPNNLELRRFLRSSLSQYLAEGGNVMIATDRPLSLADLAVEIRDRRILQRDENAYGGAPECPLLSVEETDHPIFRLLNNKIATNCPGYVNVNHQEGPRPLQGLLNFPPDGQGGKWPPMFRPKLPRNFPYMVGSAKDAPPEGRTLIIAGHGIFMNSMMLQPDIDNFAFAVNAVQWLREGPNDRKRSKALFIVDGTIISDFNMNLTPPPPPIPMPTTDMVNRLLRGLEDEGFFHWALSRILGDQYGPAAPILIVLATCVLLIYGGKKVLEGRYLRDTTVPKMVGQIPIAASVAPHVQQRRQALRRPKDLTHESIHLIAQWFQAEFGFMPPELGKETIAEFRATGFLLFRRALQRQADFVLKLANAQAAVTSSRADFAAIVRSLPKLSAALKDGRLTLLLDGKEVRQTKN